MLNVKNLVASDNFPHEFHVFIEISMNAAPVKYEFDSITGMMVVDRFICTGMSYPCNYGFIPGTLAGDGDQIDALVYTNYPVLSGTLIKVRPLGVIITEDDKGKDEKILSVPVARLDPFFDKINSYYDLPKIFIDRVNYFFNNYKILEENKWSKVIDWYGVDYAKKIIQSAVVKL